MAQGSILLFLKTWVAQNYLEAKRGYCLATANWRQLPDFIIIGAQKGGTTSLYAYLCEHPQVLPAFSKEVHYFDYNFHKGLPWYYSNFPLSLRLHALESWQHHKLVTGEASPYYLFHPLAPQRISTLLPDVKLIVVLRNPIDRAFSHYQMMVRKGVETLPFEEAMEAEMQRLEEDRARLEQDNLYRAEKYQRMSYVSRGLYFDQLLRFDQFACRGQLLVLKSEDFFAYPQDTYDLVLNFLGLEPWQLKDIQPQNQGHYQDQIKPGTYEHLVEFYRPNNLKLYEYLGKDFNW